MNREELLKSISEDLHIFESKVLSSNDLFMLDRAKLAEDFYACLFTLIYGRDFLNTNYLRANFPAIDLASQNLKTSVQVTSSLDKTKYKETVEMFFKHKLNEKYQNLHLLSIGDPHYENEEILHDVKIKTLKRKDLIAELAQLRIEVLVLIRQFLDAELYTKIDFTPDFRKRRLPIFLPQSLDLRCKEDSSKIASLFKSHPLVNLLDSGFASMTRSLLQEISENSFRHGLAKSVEIQVGVNSIIFMDDGQEFNPKKVKYIDSKDGRNFGRKIYLSYFKRKMRNAATLKYRYDDKMSKNVVSISFAQWICDISPIENCVIWESEIGTKELVSDCEVVFLTYDTEKSVSHNSTKLEKLRNLASSHQGYGIAIEETEKEIADELKQEFPDLKIKFIKENRS
nr:hypothetical protein CKG001_32120 [Bdellovibrio sp. CKG001]